MDSESSGTDKINNKEEDNPGMSLKQTIEKNTEEMNSESFTQKIQEEKNILDESLKNTIEKNTEEMDSEAFSPKAQEEKNILDASLKNTIEKNTEEMNSESFPQKYQEEYIEIKQEIIAISPDDKYIKEINISSEKEIQVNKNIYKSNGDELNDLEINDLEEKIKENEIQKNEVEAMLEKVRDSIEGINSLEDYSEENRKPNIGDKNEPIKNYEEAKRKSELNANKLKKFREEQLQREKKLAKDLEKIKKKIEQQKKILMLEQENQKGKKNEEYKSELEKMRERKLKRKQELEEIKKRHQELETVKKTKPLYMKIEEKYLKEIEIPEMQQRKAELEKKRLAHSPIRSADLIEHAKWHDEIKEENRQRSEKEFQKRMMGVKIRSSSYGLTSWTNRVLDEDKKLKSELNRANQERLNMVERKTRYADLVKEMFSPTIDRLKKQESESNKIAYFKEKKIVNSKSPKRFDNMKSGSEPDLRKTSYKKPKKFKENPLVPKPLKKKDVKVIDFLEERRKNRQEEEPERGKEDLDWKKDLDSDLPDHEKAKILKRKAKKLEKEAKKQELLIGVVNPSNSKMLQQTENVNDLLLNSIKAKLAVLDHKIN